MSAKSSIEWTDRTWNPVRGCRVVSPGCINCYAMKTAHRFSGPGKPYDGLTKQTKAGPQWTGVVRPVEAALLEPLSWRKPQRVFVNSMSDLFHEDVPDAFIDQVFAVMALAPRHTFQILTKRAERMRDYLTEPLGFSLRRKGRVATIAYQMGGMLDGRTLGRNQRQIHNVNGALGRLKSWPLPNVWLGVSVEDQPHADARIPQLLQTPAAVRFISAEPLIGPVDFSAYITGRCDRAEGYPRSFEWLIVGGESGPGARPFRVEWASSIIRQCKAAGVPCFVKQLGAIPLVPAARLRHWEWGGEIRSDRDATFSDYQATVAGDRTWRVHLDDRKGGDMAEWPDDLRVREWPQVGA